MQESSNNVMIGVGTDADFPAAYQIPRSQIYSLAEMDKRVRALNGREMASSAKLREVTPDQISEFEEDHIDQLYLMDKAFKKIGVKRVVVEAAHIYGYENPGMEHYHQMDVAAKFVASLQNQGLEVVNALFIDDLHAQGNIKFDIPMYVREAASRGWPIDEVYYESDMSELANHLISTLEALGKVTDLTDKRILNRGKVELVKPNLRQDPEPSCALLDAAFTGLKLRKHNAQAIVNVLPEISAYKRQQYNTRTILRAALGQEALPFFNLFVNLERNGKPKHKVGRSHIHG